MNAYIVKVYKDNKLKAHYIFESLKMSMVFASKMAADGYKINFIRTPLEEL